jgi:hypothetical protein
MADDQGLNLESKEGRGSRVWIIVGVVVLGIALCCCATLAAWFAGDAVLELIGVFP